MECEFSENMSANTDDYSWEQVYRLMGCRPDDLFECQAPEPKALKLEAFC